MSFTFEQGKKVPLILGFFLVFLNSLHFLNESLDN